MAPSGNATLAIRHNVVIDRPLVRGVREPVRHNPFVPFTRFRQSAAKNVPLPFFWSYGMCCTSLLMFGVLLVSASDQWRVLVNEGFDGALPRSFQWVREDPSEWRIQDGQLQVRSQFGRIWGGNDARNVLLVESPKAGRIDAQVSVTHQPKELYEQAGLLWYVDDDNFVKLISEQIQGKMHVVIAREVDKRGEVIGKLEVPTANVQLRLLVDGNRVTGQWRINNDDAWNDAGTCPFEVPGNRRFGLFTQNGPKDAVRWVAFDRFILSQAGK